MKKIGFLGCGKIGHRIASHIIDHHLGKITFIQDPFFENTLNLSCPVIDSASETLLAQSDLIIECATADILKANIHQILMNCDLLLFSVTAFADPDFESQVHTLCQTYGHKIYIPHGAIIGLDGIIDGRKLWQKVTIETRKSPESLGRSDRQETVLYEGSTRGACNTFPRNVNVHAAVALSGIGFDRTFSKIIAVPGMAANEHTITLEGDGARFQIHVRSFAAGSITGAYTPLSACGSIDRILNTSSCLLNV